MRINWKEKLSEKLGKKTKLPGIVQWFQKEDRNLVTETADILADLKIKEFRILFSWVDWESPHGKDWFDFFTKEIVSKNPKIKLIPVLFYTPTHLARKDNEGKQKNNYPPRDLNTYALFVREIITRYGKHFDWIQIWDEPNTRSSWEWEFDPDLTLFSEMTRLACLEIHAHGKRACLGGLAPYETEWITLLHHHRVLKDLDAVAINYSPGKNDQHKKWYGFKVQLDTVRAHLKGFGSNAKVWIGESGYSTMPREGMTEDEIFQEQIIFFEQFRTCNADKHLWYCVKDQAENKFGLVKEDGSIKPLFEHWKNLCN